MRDDFVRKYLLNRSEDAKNEFFRKFYIDLVTPTKNNNIFFDEKIINLSFEKIFFENVKMKKYFSEKIIIENFY